MKKLHIGAVAPPSTQSSIVGIIAGKHEGMTIVPKQARLAAAVRVAFAM